MSLSRAVLIITSFLIISESLYATNYFVDDNSSADDVFCLTVNGDNSNDGLTALTPKLSLTNLLSTYSAVFSSGDTIFVDAGQYSDNNLSSPINGVVIQGAGMGVTNFVNGCADCYFMYIDDNNTTLSSLTLEDYNDQTAGAGQVIGVLSGTVGVNIWFVQVYKTSTTSSGSDFPIIVKANTDVYFKGGGNMCNTWVNGGGIKIEGALTNVLIENYILKGNGNYGGSPACAGVWIENGNVKIENSLFEDNEVSSSTTTGAALYVETGNVEVVDCLFDNNKTRTSSTLYGGTIFIGGGVFRIARSIVSNHTKTFGSGKSRGAGIAIYGSATVTIDTCIFESNQGHTTQGMDFYNRDGTVIINDTQFNSSTDQIGCYSGTTSISYSGSPSADSYYDTGLSFDNNFSHRASPNLSGILPEYIGDCSSSITILSVDLAFFTGDCQGDEVDIQWATISEDNNDYFIIEKSQDGEYFEEVATIDGAGNSTELLHYSISDRKLNNQPVYYRLIQVDFDGERTVFPLIVIEGNCNDEQKPIEVAANLSSNTILVYYDLPESKNTVLNLYDLKGKMIYAENVFLSKNKKVYESNVLKSLEAGMYIIQLSGENINQASSKFIIGY